MNGMTLAALYFLVASGFTLVFGLMRNVNLAHGSLYLLGAYVGFNVGDWTGSWFLGVAAGFLAWRWSAPSCRSAIFRRMQGQDLRQTLVTIGLSIVMADHHAVRSGAARPISSIRRAGSPAGLRR